MCAEVLTNIGAGLDDAQLTGTLDFIVDGVDEALREVLSLLADEEADADRRSAVEPEIAAEMEVDGEGDGATVIALPEVPQPVRSAGTAAAVAGGPARMSAQTPAGAMTEGVPADMADATVEMAAVVDGPGPGAPGDAEGGTGVETTNTSKPLLVS